jgi:hypothetical protein
MTASEIIGYARNTLDDLIEPYKWSNLELTTYLNDAQDEAARRSHCIICHPSPITITGSSDISFSATAKTITKSTGGFLSAGGLSEVSTFEKDDTIQVTDTTSNDGNYTIITVTDTVIKVSETLVDESDTSATIEDIRNVTRIPMSIGVHTYRLHPKVLMVLRARPDSATWPLRQKTVQSLDADMSVVDYEVYSGQDTLLNYDSWETLTDNTFAFIEENGFIRIVSPPSATDVLWLIVSRLPKLTFTDYNLKSSPEIPAQYHQDLVDWLVHRAYLKQDTETQDMAKAKLWEDSFTSKFGPRPSAQTEQNRRKFPPNQRMRARSFGFGG